MTRDLSGVHGPKLEVPSGMGVRGIANQAPPWTKDGRGMLQEPRGMTQKEPGHVG